MIKAYYQTKRNNDNTCTKRTSCSCSNFDRLFNDSNNIYDKYINKNIKCHYKDENSDIFLNNNGDNSLNLIIMFIIILAFAICIYIPICIIDYTYRDTTWCGPIFKYIDKACSGNFHRHTIITAEPVVDVKLSHINAEPNLDVIDDDKSVFEDDDYARRSTIVSIV